MSELKAQQKISQFGQILDSATDPRLSHPCLVGLSWFIAHSVRIIPAQLVIEPDFPNTNLFLPPDMEEAPFIEPSKASGLISQKRTLKSFTSVIL
jgi:hypothetical protein